MADALSELEQEKEIGGEGTYRRDLAPVDRLMEVEDAILERHGYEVDPLDGKGVVYGEVYEEAGELLSDLAYDAGDLEEFVRANVNRGRSEVRGIYTGVLAHLLTEREDGTTRIHVDGAGQRFDYLFAMARRLDEVYVENFEGDSILYGAAGGPGGEADYIVMENLSGYRIGGSIGNTGGEAGIVAFRDVDGGFTGEHIAAGRGGVSPHHRRGNGPGTVETVIFDGVEGERPGSRIGFCGALPGVAPVDLVLTREFPLEYVGKWKAPEMLDEEDVGRLVTVEDLPRRYRDAFPLDYSDRDQVEEAVADVKEYLDEEGLLRRGMRRGRASVRKAGATVGGIVDG